MLKVTRKLGKRWMERLCVYLTSLLFVFGKVADSKDKIIYRSRGAWWGGKIDVLCDSGSILVVYEADPFMQRA